MRKLLAVVALAAALGLWGCSREQAPKGKTVAQVQAEIQKVESDAKMPPNVKSMVLGLLRQELDRAQKAEKPGR